MTMPETSVNPQDAIQGWIGGLGNLVEEPPKEERKDDGQSLEPKGTETAPVAGADGKQPDAPVKPEPSVTPAEKPAATKPTDTDALTDPTKWPRSAQQWKEYKEQFRREKEELQSQVTKASDELTALRKKLEEPRAPDPSLDLLKKERDELSERLRISAIERHPKFEAYFGNRVKQQIELAKTLVGPDNAEAVAKILTLPDSEYKSSRLEDIMGNFTPLQQAQFGGVLNSLAAIEIERQGEISKAREHYDQMQASEKTAREQQVATLKSSFENAALEAQKTNPVFQKREGDNAWNTSVEKRLEQAKMLFTGEGARPEQVIKACLDAAALPAVLEGYQAILSENEQLKAQVASLSKASPTVGTATTQPTTPPSQHARLSPGMRPDAAVTEWMKGLTEES